MKYYISILILGLTLSGCAAIQNSPVGQVMEKVPGVNNANQPKVTEEMLKDISDPLVRKNMVATFNQTKSKNRSVVGTGKNQMINVTEFDMSGGTYNYKTGEEKNGTLLNEMVFMGETTYAKDYSDNKWWKETSKPEALPSSEAGEANIPKPIDIQEETTKSTQSSYKAMGQEPCGESAPGLTCYVYEETYPENSGSRKFWFDTKDFLTRKEEQGTGAMKALTQMWYDNISVTAPSPTKDVPQGESIFMMLGKQQYEQQLKESGANVKQVLPENLPEIPNQDAGNDYVEDNGNL